MPSVVIWLLAGEMMCSCDQLALTGYCSQSEGCDACYLSDTPFRGSLSAKGMDITRKHIFCDQFAFVAQCLSRIS